MTLNHWMMFTIQRFDVPENKEEQLNWMEATDFNDELINLDLDAYDFDKLI